MRRFEIETNTFTSYWAKGTMKQIGSFKGNLLEPPK